MDVENGLCLCFLLLLFLGLLHEGIGARNDFSGVSGMKKKKGHNSQSLPANGRRKKELKTSAFLRGRNNNLGERNVHFSLFRCISKNFFSDYTVGSLFGPHDMVTVLGFLFFPPPPFRIKGR